MSESFYFILHLKTWITLLSSKFRQFGSSNWIGPSDSNLSTKIGFWLKDDFDKTSFSLYFWLKDRKHLILSQNPSKMMNDFFTFFIFPSFLIKINWFWLNLNVFEYIDNIFNLFLLISNSSINFRQLLIFFVATIR